MDSSDGVPANVALSGTLPIQTRKVTMSDSGQFTHTTAPNQYVQAGGTTFAYRRFGKVTDGVPLVFQQQFTANMDNWDPLVIDLFAQDREVVLFDNVGIGNSTGSVPTRVEAMAADAGAFIDALGLTTVDLLGFSLGGILTQLLAKDRPDLVRKLILVGAGPRGGVGMQEFTPRVNELFATEYEDPEQMWLPLFFTETEESRSAGQAFIDRTQLRTKDRSPRSGPEVAGAQIEAIREWGLLSEGSYNYLHDIKQPTLVVNGDDDMIVSSVNSWIMQQEIPNAQLHIFPDSGHGSWGQYPELFHKYASIFLNN